ncbi:MAG: carboxypeptidase-like regulatory domain-containing protein [Chitinophagales bacterium]
MKSCRLFFIPLTFFISATVFGQFTVTGKVMDSSSMEPLYGASVFCQNTTSGTTTDKQGEFSLPLKSGGYELIISFTGYQTKQIRITNADNSPLQIQMIKEEKSMEEVVIRSSNEVMDGWDKYGKFFLENFIGSTPDAAQCTLQNPEAIHFYYYKKSDKLKVLATDPVVISNKALGYNLRYQLDSFMYYYKTQVSSYRGYCFFTEMQGSFSEQKAWSENRKKAYYGSKLHFMRSYYDSSLNDDNFEIAMLDSNNDKKFDPVRNPYDTTYYEVDDSTNEAEVYFPRKISVTYKKKPEPQYLQKFKLPGNVGAEISYIDLLDGIVIKENGYFYDQKDWINQGYWSWKNLADLLPYDYIP